MNKVPEIRKAIRTYLKTKHSSVYYEVADDNAPPLHVVYDLPDSMDDGSMERFVLEIDGWDAPADGDTTALETLMDIIDGDGDRTNPSGLHRRTVVVAGPLSLTFYRENRLSLRDDDKRIRRRKYVYQVRVHGIN